MRFWSGVVGFCVKRLCNASVFDKCLACSPRGAKSNTSTNVITRGGAMHRARDCPAGKEAASACASRTVMPTQEPS